MASLKKRGSSYYLQYYVNGEQRRVSLNTSSVQIAKEKKRQFESAQLRGDDIPLPTKTPLADIVTAYIDHIKQHKTRSSVSSDLYYLRTTFGPLCPALDRPGMAQDAKADRIEATYLEDIRTSDVARFIAAKVASRNLAPKTANRYREILHRIFKWAMEERGINMPGGRNPVARVNRYKEKAPEIVFLTLEQIDKQLKALEENRLLQTMVAVYIYAGLRREEALWLQLEDLDRESGPNGMLRIRAKTVNGEHWQPKTKTNRVVPISRALRQYLERYEPRIVPDHWLFPSPDGKRWDADNFGRSLREANHNARLKWSCALYRHTFGSQLAMKGESLYKIATLMGNSPCICRRHYAGLSPECLDGTVEFTADASEELFKCTTCL